MEYRIDAKLHIVSVVEADTKEEAREMFVNSLEWDGELWGDEVEVLEM